MGARALVVYATQYGSTAEVARAVGEVLNREGVGVEILPAARAGGLAGYDALVLGSSVRMGRLLPESVRFMRRHRVELERLKVAYFLTCMTMSVDNPANRRQAESYLAPLRAMKEPLSVGLFGGKTDRRRFGPLLRLFAALDKSGTLTDGDYRDWAHIREWAHKLALALTDGGE